MAYTVYSDWRALCVYEIVNEDPKNIEVSKTRTIDERRMDL